MSDQPNIFAMPQGNEMNGGGFMMGALMGRLLFNNNDNNTQNSDRAAIESAVSSALAQNNQANNNAMLLLKDIQDSSQGVIAAVTAGATQATNAAMQGQIATLQGQAVIGASIADSKYTTVNEIHESATDVIASNTANTAQLAATMNSLGASLAAGHADLSREILQSKYDGLLAIKTSEGVIRDDIRNLKESLPSARELEWQTKYLAEREDNHHNRTRGSIDSGNTTVTTNVNQATAVAQNQTNLMNEIRDLRGELQRNTQSTIAIGSTMMGNSQTATNVRQ